MAEQILKAQTAGDHVIKKNVTDLGAMTSVPTIV